MKTPETSTEERLIPGDLIATLAARAHDPGPNPTDWPGLTLYRFTAPTAPQWDQVGALSVCVVAQGRKAVTVDGVRHCYDPFHYFVLRRSLTFQVEILTASIEKPYLAFVSRWIRRAHIGTGAPRRCRPGMIGKSGATRALVHLWHHCGRSPAQVSASESSSQSGSCVGRGALGASGAASLGSLGIPLLEPDIESRLGTRAWVR